MLKEPIRTMKLRIKACYGIMVIMGLLMLGQIVLGFAWMALNISAIPVFGNTPEYIALSNNLILDEYRPILFPLILHFVIKAGTLISFPYQSVLYVLQTLACFGSVYFFFLTAANVIRNKLATRLTGPTDPDGHGLSPTMQMTLIIFTLYIITIPPITCFNFSVLTDSLALSCLIVLTAYLVRFLYLDKNFIHIAIGIALSFAAQSLLRADRLYIGAFLILIALLTKSAGLKRSTHQRCASLLAVVLALVLALAAVKTVAHFTQTPGIHGRVKTDFAYILLNRVAFPNIAAYYGKFPTAIQSIFTIEEARLVDSHHNNVMYGLAPRMESSVGKEKASKLYIEMSQIVFHNQPGKIIRDIAQNTAALIAAPLTLHLSLSGKFSAACSWNVHCVSQAYPDWSKWYYRYFIYTFTFLFWPVTIVLFGINFLRKSALMQITHAIIFPVFLAVILIALWFSIGSGAVPNDRYELVAYVCWGMVFLAETGYFCLTMVAPKLGTGKYND